MLRVDDTEKLILPLLEGLTGEPLWGAFVDALRARLGADYASIVFRPIPFGQPQSRVVHLASGAQWPPLIAQLYRDGLYREDPLPYFSLFDGRVYALDDLLSSGDPVHDDYRRRTLEPSGMNVLRIMRVEEKGGVSAWITVSRREGDFGEDARGLLAGLAPYLRAALAAHVAMQRERTRAEVAGEAIRRLNFGWLTLDGQGRILDLDSQAQRALNAGAGLARTRGGRLVARDPQASADIAEAVARMAGERQARPQAIVLSRDPWLDMLLVPAGPQESAAGPAPAVIAYLHADNWSSADRTQQLAQLFDLIPSEARLALALSRGMSLSEAAVDLGLTRESARTYAKRIFAKTGARGQADLVRFIHRSVLAIA